MQRPRSDITTIRDISMTTISQTGVGLPAHTGYASLTYKDQPVKVFYTDTGNRQAHAPVIAMLHGSGPGSSGMGSFIANRPALVEAGFRVICIDIPGWGRSDPVVCTDDRSVLNARALGAALDAAGVVSPVHLLGASMGAHSAVAFALLRPERTAKLLLVAGGTGGRSSFHPQLPDGVRAMLEFYGAPNAANMQTFLRTVFHDPNAATSDVVNATLKAALARPEHLSNFSASLALQPRQFGDVSARLPDIPSPTLVVWGSDDRFVPLDIGLQIAVRIPRADLYVMGRTGHVPHLERAEEFNRLAVQFFSASA